MPTVLRRWISLTLLIGSLFAASAAEVETLPLWPDRAPVGGGQFETLRCQVSPRAVWRDAMPIGDGTPEVVYPQMTVFHPAPDRATGAAVVICVGGGYMRLVLPHEGPRVAQWLASHGVLAVVAEYRMPQGRPEVPLADAQRALRLVRSRAREWKVDPACVGIMGFSAGGHLASTAGTHFDDGDLQAADPLDRISSRPDFMLLIYPVISMGDLTHAISKKNLLGANPTPAQVERYSNEQQVTARTPPAFLAHAADDKGVPAEHSRMFFASLRAKGVPAEYLELPNGGHGLHEEKVWETPPGPDPPENRVSYQLGEPLRVRIQNDRHAVKDQKKCELIGGQECSLCKHGRHEFVTPKQAHIFSSSGHRRIGNFGS